nr:Ground region domain containing protein [Haemonchus contortus]
MDITIESHPKVEEQAQLGLTFAPSQDEFKNESPAATTFDVAESPLDNFFYPEDVADITQTTTISSTSIDYEEVYAQKRIAENKSTTEVIQAITDETPPADDKLRPPIYVEASHFETFEPAVETVTVDVTINYTNTNSEPENENDNLDTSTTEVAYVENYSLRQREDPQRKMKDVAVTQPADAFWTFPQEDLHEVKPAKAFRGLNSMIVQKHRESGVVGKQSLREATGKRQSVLVDVFRKEKFKHSFGRKRDREGQKPKCNSAALWNIMEQKMSTSASASKQVLYSAVLARFPGRIASVICSRFSFSYIVVTSPIYCEHRKTPLTCFAFIQP